jgi:hypothetical protein
VLVRVVQPNGTLSAAAGKLQGALAPR